MSYGRRLRRSQRVATSARAFNDRRDGIDGNFYRRGGLQLFDLAQNNVLPPPRSIVHRFLSARSTDLADLFRGMGGELAPHVSLRPRPVSPVVRISAAVRLPQSPLQAQKRIADSWRAFNALRVRAPTQTRFCVQRKQRREVLFARKVAGRRGLGAGGVRRTENSQWSC